MRHVKQKPPAPFPGQAVYAPRSAEQDSDSCCADAVRSAQDAHADDVVVVAVAVRVPQPHSGGCGEHGHQPGTRSYYDHEVVEHPNQGERSQRTERGDEAGGVDGLACGVHATNVI